MCAIGIVIVIVLTVLPEVFTQIKANSNVISENLTILVNEGVAHDRQGNYTGVILSFDKALVINPKNITALTGKGGVLDELGNYTGAILYLDKALTLNPNDVDAINNKGTALDNLGNHTGAIEYYDKALSINPHYVLALNNKGWALNSLRNYTGAIEYYDKALAVDPHYFNSLYNKGLALDELGNHSGAIQYYDKALAINPHSVNALTNKGVALYDLGKYHDAIVSYDKALTLNPNDVDAINNKANALGKLGKSLEAIQYYQRAIKLIQSNQTSRLAFTPTKSLYVFVSENDGSNIQTVDSGDNGQNQTKIIIMNMSIAERYKSINDYQAAIVIYTDILHVNPYYGCALLGRADAYEKIAPPQLDNAGRDEKLGNMLKPTCNTGGTNFLKPADLGQSIASFASKLNVFQ